MNTNESAVLDERASDSESPCNGWPTGGPTAQVDAELERVLSSRAFAQSRRQQRFLQYLVQQVLAGKSSVLKESVVAIEVFERPADRFDPRADSIVRVEARRLRQRLDSYYADEGAKACLRIELPVGGYVPVLRWQHVPQESAMSRRARDLVERGEHFLRQGSESALHKALERFESAAAEAPGCPAAHKGAAQACIALVCAWHVPTVPWVDRAMASLRQALALDARDPVTAVLMGVVHHRLAHDWPTAQQWLRQAVQTAPQSALAHCGLGFYLALAGCYDEAEAELRLSRSIDPHYLNARLFMAKLRIAQRRWDDADKEIESLLDIAPQHFSGRQTRADLRRCRGEFEDALSLYADLQTSFPEHAAGLVGQAQVFASLARTQDSERCLALATQMMGGRIPPYCLAVARASAGQLDETMALLEESAKTQDPAFIFSGMEPAFDPLREEPRFIELFRRCRA